MDRIGEITGFISYLDEDITSAIRELKNVPEQNRRHLQKLVYVDVANRFDSLVDSLIISFATNDTDFRRNVLNNLDEPMSQGDLFKVLLSDDPQQEIIERIKKELSMGFLSFGHGRKMADLLGKCYKWPDTDTSRPRVNPNTGSISTSKVKKHASIANSVLGYSDWIYHRRNILVHRNNGSRSFSDSNIKYFKKRYNVTLAKTVNIKLASIESASKFYKDFCNELLKYEHSFEMA